MGASISVRVSSAEKRTKMLAFLSEHYRRWEHVVAGAGYLNTDPDDFEIRKKDISFDYSALHGWERVYVYSTIRWIALKVGDKKTRFRKDDVEPNVFLEPVPYMIYDEFDSWPILVCKSERDAMKLPIKHRWCSTDEYGVYLSERTSESLVCAANEGALFDVDREKAQKVQKAFTEELGALGEWPPYGSKEYQQRMEKYKRIRAKYARTEIKVMLPKVRGELKRLDKLWSTLKEKP